MVDLWNGIWKSCVVEYLVVLWVRICWAWEYLHVKIKNKLSVHWYVIVLSKKTKPVIFYQRQIHQKWVIFASRTLRTLSLDIHSIKYFFSFLFFCLDTIFKHRKHNRSSDKLVLTITWKYLTIAIECTKKIWKVTIIKIFC